MDKITAVKVRYEDGTYSNEMPIGVLAENVEWNDESSLVDIINNIINTKSNWAEGNESSSAFIQNKPAIKAGTGENSVVEGNIQTNIASSYVAHAEGYGTTASGSSSHAEGTSTTASGLGSHAEGAGAKATGSQAHAEGNLTTASGNQSHAEGYQTSASGAWSHAEGYYTKAESVGAHAEGQYTQAKNKYSHAEGNHTIASGSYSHAEGDNTIAASDNQHTQGKYNIADEEGVYADIIGNGKNETNRSNAYTLDWNGNAWYAGKITVEGTPTNDKDLVTKAWVEAQGYSKDGGGGSIPADWEERIQAAQQAAEEAAAAAEQAKTDILTDRPDWSVIDTTSLAYIKNKPSLKSGTGANSIAQGSGTNALGDYSHAEGGGTAANSQASHAEGRMSTAAGTGSHAEGIQTSTGNNGAHSEGYRTNASGTFSHAEGSQSRASGSYSHAEGQGTRAKGSCQHVQGKYNIEDNNNIYANIVGNGTSDSSRSNACTLDWNGNGWYAGKVSAGTASAPADPTAANDLVTKHYLDQGVVARVTAIEQNGAKDTTARTNISNQVTRATAAESALDTRVAALEASGGGTPGKDGKDGADGFSPIATVTQGATSATISITDKNGTTTATIQNGAEQDTTARSQISAEVTRATNAEGALNTKVTALEQADTTFNTKVTALEQADTALDTRVTALEQAGRKANYTEVLTKTTLGTTFRFLVDPVMGSFIFDMYGTWSSQPNTEKAWITLGQADALKFDGSVWPDGYKNHFQFQKDHKAELWISADGTVKFGQTATIAGNTDDKPASGSGSRVRQIWPLPSVLAPLPEEGS